MKKILSVALVMITTVSLFLAMYTVTVAAVNEAYPTTIYPATAPPTMDGKYTNATEWDDGDHPAGLQGGLFFKNKYYMTGTYGEPDFAISDYYIVEYLTDGTNDAGDYVQICYDGNTEFFVGPDGGTAPKTNDLKVEYWGHNGTIKTYKGTGTGWNQTDLVGINVTQSLSASNASSTPHWITEFRISKADNTLDVNNGIMVAAYDASNSAAGVKAFPPQSSPDVPNGWSLNTASFEPIVPEGIDLFAVVVLSSAALLVGSYYLRKRPKTSILPPMKL